MADDGNGPASAMKADLETITSLAKQRGFVFPSAEIYGGFAATYDYGPLGVEMRRNIRESWWQWMVQGRDDVVGIEGAIITNPDVWRASGHVDAFTDPLVDCLQCNARVRADHIVDGVCPSCGTKDRFTEERDFNLLLRTSVGPVADEGAIAYLRPETAQGMFVNFENVLNSTRRRLPFGIAQIGKSFRNEITTQQFIFRTREFEQMEMEFFCHPENALDWFAYWREERMRWYQSIGVRAEHLRFRDHDEDERSHYSSATTDIEVHYPWGWSELEGVAYRGNYDLTVHQEHSGKSLSYFDQQAEEHIIPHVVEPAVGVDRVMLTLLMDAYDEDEVAGEKRVVMRFAPNIAPVAVGVLPLSRNDKLLPTARRVHDVLRPHFRTWYDDAQSIGRRYRRQDEIGTPLCVTVDFETIDDDAVTIRDRDTTEQIRVPISGLVEALRGRLHELQPAVDDPAPIPERS